MVCPICHKMWGLLASGQVAACPTCRQWPPFGASGGTVGVAAPSSADLIIGFDILSRIALIAAVLASEDDCLTFTESDLVTAVSRTLKITPLEEDGRIVYMVTVQETS